MSTGTSSLPSSFIVLIGFRLPSLPTTARPKPNPLKSSSFGSLRSSFLGVVYPPEGSLEFTPSVLEAVSLASAKGESMPATRATATAVTEARFLCFLVSSDTATQA